MEFTPQRPTVTQIEQGQVEQNVSQIYKFFGDIPPDSQSILLEIWRDTHITFLLNSLGGLGPGFKVLDANRPWLCYWILHSLALLGEILDYDLEQNTIDFLSRCQCAEGGYGGGPGQMPHLATTYAAVNSLITIGNKRALSSIDRNKMRLFLGQMKDDSGAFRMHDGGEMDVRACYTGISVASVLNILDYNLVQNVGNYILSCQTFEGGISGEPGSEAHGGYTFCGLATMILIGEADRLNLSSLLNWAVFRQGVECGFQGRINKLVDGCYSFWQGGVLVLLQKLSPEIHKISNKKPCQTAEIPNCEGEFQDIGYSFLQEITQSGPLFNSIGLQQYLLLCCQEPMGGFKDKPGKPRDFYHTCYCLSGLSLCHHCSTDVDSPPPQKAVLGSYDNVLEPVHPLFNVIVERYRYAHDFFFQF